MARIEFNYNDIEIRSNIADLERKVDKAVDDTMSYHALEGTKYMKENAPWTDRTTAARNGLHAIPSQPRPGLHEIVFSHTVHYGIWLEIANSGRYQIIMPTVSHEGQLLMQRLRGLFGKLDRMTS
ncbi:hypothetical protein GJ25_gp022 [Mycobacterium phage Hawkeye]|uniref:Minor tail protein n=1 Tax=Mycobacterium phage Hawkeye TaxID=1458711 RepID=X2KRF9_9CAUD|nr:hypothetical protein GJ25_gp022 [Mycobacterium phage Hawkeye]AHN84033.1 hypothetical protein PBI_HAWKEYE_22 [Mycobacterium phage Hawkeye]